jgi:hypothetical protein
MLFLNSLCHQNSCVLFPNYGPTVAPLGLIIEFFTEIEKYINDVQNGLKKTFARCSLAWKVDNWI